MKHGSNIYNCVFSLRHETRNFLTEKPFCPFRPRNPFRSAIFHPAIIAHPMLNRYDIGTARPCVYGRMKWQWQWSQLSYPPLSLHHRRRSRKYGVAFEWPRVHDCMRVYDRLPPMPSQYPIRRPPTRNYPRYLTLIVYDYEVRGV